MMQRTHEGMGGSLLRVARWPVLVLLAWALGLAAGGCGVDDEAELQARLADEAAVQAASHDDLDLDDVVPTAYPVEYELTYDDGIDDEILAAPGRAVGSQIAVRFTPRRYPAQLVAARFYIAADTPGGTPFVVRVYDDDGPEGAPGTILGVFATSGRRSRVSPWAEVAPRRALPQITDGDFYVAMVWQRAPGKDGLRAQVLGADTSAPDRRTWLKAVKEPLWRRAEKLGKQPSDRDAMIRVRLR